MTNFPFTQPSQLRDVESINLLAQAEKDGRTDWAWNGILRKGRDNARTPMQWDATENAGFTDGAPWIGVNPNYPAVNVERAMADENSILHFYRRLIALRAGSETLKYGDFHMLLPDDPHVFTYERSLRGERVIVCCNFSDRPVPLPDGIGGETLLCSGLSGHGLAAFGLAVLKAAD